MLQCLWFLTQTFKTKQKNTVAYLLFQLIYRKTELHVYELIYITQEIIIISVNLNIVQI